MESIMAINDYRIIEKSDWNTYFIEDLIWISMYMIEDKYLALGMVPHDDYSEHDLINNAVHLLPHINYPGRGIRFFENK